MALDTRQKRSSAIGVNTPWRFSLPVADGAIGVLDRQQTALVYAGIQAEVLAQATLVYRWEEVVSIDCDPLPKPEIDVIG